MFGVPFLLFLFYFLLFLAALFIQQQKIREARLKKSVAETRLNDLSDKYRRRVQSARNSTNYQITPFHTTRSEWIKKDMQYVQTEESIRRHKLTANILKGNPEISDIFNNQVNNLKKESKDIREQKSEIKDKGRNDYSDLKAFRKNSKEDERAYRTYQRKSDQCIEKISNYDKIIHGSNRCNIL